MCCQPVHQYDYNKLAYALRSVSLPALLEVLPVICDTLKEQNQSFDSGLFQEWALEGK